MDSDVLTLTHGIVERSMADEHFEVRVADAVIVCRPSRVLRRIGVAIREGDRVSIRTVEDQAGGEITQVRAPLEALPIPPVPRASLISGAARIGLKPADQRLDRSLRPGWPTAADCRPQAGDQVYCTAGDATLMRIHGRTGNGSRLLELRLPDRPRAPFFAAASNVVVAPVDPEVVAAAPGSSGE